MSWELILSILSILAVLLSAIQLLFKASSSYKLLGRLDRTVEIKIGEFGAKIKLDSIDEEQAKELIERLTDQEKKYSSTSSNDSSEEEEDCK